MNESSIRQLDDDAHLRHQRLEWRVERAGWLAMAAVVVCALLGLLGRGPLSEMAATSGDRSLSVRYGSIEHQATPAWMTFTLRPSGTSRMTQLALSRRFCDAITIESIVPPPSSAVADGEKVLYSFPVSPGQGLVVQLRYKCDEYGVLNFQARIDGKEPVAVRQRVLP